MQRDLTLDSFRGLCLVAMMIDHLALPLSNYTIHSLGFISAAECFVFLSGYVAGVVYTKIRKTSGQSELWQAAINRAKSIYLVHMAIFLLLLVMGLDNKFLILAWKQNIYNFSDPLMFNNPPLALILGTVLLYQPTFLDILPLYFVLLLLMPVVLNQFLKGHSYIVLLSSAFIWGIAQFGLLSFLTSYVGKHIPVFLGAFDVFAWQIIFVVGLYFGFLKSRKINISKIFNNKLLIIASLLVVSLFLVHHNIIDFHLSGNENFLSKERLGFVRLINFAAIIYLVAQAKVHFNDFFQWSWLSQLGQHSLQVYAFHVILIFLLAPVVTQISSLPTLSATLITTLIVFSLFIPAKLHQSYRDYQNNLEVVEDKSCSTA